MLLVVIGIGFTLLCNLIYKISLVLTFDSQFIDRNIIIVPAVIGLMSLSNFYFVKKTSLTVVRAVSAVFVTITPLTAFTDSPMVTTTNPVVKRIKSIFVTAISLVVKICSTIVTVINYVLRKPFIFISISNALAYKSNSSFTGNMFIALHFFAIIILTINHLQFTRIAIYFALFLTICANIFLWYYNIYESTSAIVFSFIILLLFLGLLFDIHSHNLLLCTVVAQCIVIFICDSVSFVEIPLYISKLRWFCILSFVFFETVLYIT